MTSFVIVAVLSNLILATLLILERVSNLKVQRELLNRLLVKNEMPPITEELPAEPQESQSSRRLKVSSNHSRVRFNMPEVTKLPVRPLGEPQ